MAKSKALADDKISLHANCNHVWQGRKIRRHQENAKISTFSLLLAIFSLICVVKGCLTLYHTILPFNGSDKEAF